MQLDSLRVSSETGLCVNVSSFQPLTLLVGVSGAGKSQILMYIETLFKLLQGHTASNLEDGEYELCFHLNEDNYHYLVYIQDHHPVIERLWLNREAIRIWNNSICLRRGQFIIKRKIITRVPGFTLALRKR